MKRVAKSAGAYVLAFVVWDVIFALLNAGPETPPEWWTMLFFFGEVWGLAWLAHLAIHALWDNLLGAVFLTLLTLALPWFHAKATWREYGRSDTATVRPHEPEPY